MPRDTREAVLQEVEAWLRDQAATWYAQGLSGSEIARELADGLRKGLIEMEVRAEIKRRTT